VVLEEEVELEDHGALSVSVGGGSVETPCQRLSALSEGELEEAEA